MSTFLQLCQDARREGAMAAGTGPASVLNQTGELERIVAWIKNSWIEIQGRSQVWKWMRSPFTFNTVASTNAYAFGAVTDSRLAAIITRFSRWWPLDQDGESNVLCYLTSVGVADQQYLSYLDWAPFKHLYLRGSQTNNRPVHFTVDPQDRLLLGPNPNAVYTVTGEYQMSAQVLAADGDTPEMPAQFHQLIVYRAMEKYAGYRSAPEVMARGVSEGNRMLRALEGNQLPASKQPMALV
jgi:hypothetical protein